MKKKFKALAVAATTLAIAGIGAVSFAKWNISTTTTAHNVGVEEMIYLKETTVSNISGLKPYDQNDGYDEYKEVSIKVVVPTGKTSVDVTAKSADVATKLDETSKLYVYNEAPSAANKGNWKQVTATGTALPCTVTAGQENTITLYLILESTAIGDMGKTVSVTYTVA